MKKAFDQTVRDLKRGVNKKVLKVPSIEQKVLDATSNESWGPHGTILADIARASRNYHEYQIIMSVIWKRINDSGKNWRHVYKALTVLEYLVANGSERVIDDIREHSYQIQTLSDFQYIDSSGRDQGSNVRKKSQSLVMLVNDKDRIQEVRQKAASNRDKFRNTSMSGMHRPGSYSSSAGYGDRYEDDHYDERYGSREDDRNGYGRERDGSYRDDDGYGRYGDGRDGDRYSREYEEHINRDNEYRGRSPNNDDYQYGSGSRSSYRDRGHTYENDGQYSSRGNGSRADDQLQDGSFVGTRLDQKYSEQNVGAPPNYEEAIKAAHSPTHSERDGEASSATAPKSSSSVTAPKPTSPAASASPSQVTGGTTFATSPSPTVGHSESNGFDVFDPRGSFSAGPTMSSGAATTSGDAETDLLGSLSHPFTPNSLALVPTASLPTSEATPSTNTAFGPTYTAITSASSVPNLAFDDPFGDGPFKATPSTAGVEQQESSTAIPSVQASSQAPELPQQVSYISQPINSSVETFDGATYTPFGVSSAPVPSTNTQYSQEELSTSDQSIDILADILPPTEPQHLVNSEAGFPTASSQAFQSQSGANVHQAGGSAQSVQSASLTDFPAQYGELMVRTSSPTQSGQPVSQSGFPAQSGQLVSQSGFPAQNDQLVQESGFPAHCTQPVSQARFPAQNGRPPSPVGFPTESTQPASQEGFPAEGDQVVSQRGFPTQNGQSMSEGGFPAQSGQPVWQGGFPAQSDQPVPQGGFSAQSGQPVFQGGFLAQNGQSGSRGDFSAEVGQPSLQAGFPAQNDQPVSQSEAGSLPQSGQHIQQAGLLAQSGQPVSQAGFPAQKGESDEPVLHVDFPAQSSQHASQASFLQRSSQPIPQVGLLAQSGQPVLRGGFPAQSGQPVLQGGSPVQSGQPFPQGSYQAQSGQPFPQGGFPAHSGQQFSQGGFSAQRAPPFSQGGFLAQSGQPPALTGFPGRLTQASQTGFHSQTAQPAYITGFQSRIGQAGFQTLPSSQSSQSNAVSYGNYNLQPGPVPLGQMNAEVPTGSNAPHNGINFLSQSGSGVSLHSHIGPSASQLGSSSPVSSLAALPSSTGALAIATPAEKDKFETKSTVWADTLSRGLVNLNISGPKINPLSDIGIDFDAINRKEKRMEKAHAAPVTSTITMGKAMGAGSGVGRAGALRPSSNPMMGAGMDMGMGGLRPGIGMGGYGGMSQPGGVGMATHMPSNMGMGMNMQPVGMNMNMPSNVGMATNVGMGGQVQQPGFGMGMAGQMQQPVGMNMGMAGQMRQPTGFPPGSNMPGGYNPMMGTGNFNQQPYGGGYQ